MNSISRAIAVVQHFAFQSMASVNEANFPSASSRRFADGSHRLGTDRHVVFDFNLIRDDVPFDIAHVVDDNFSIRGV